MLWIALKCLSIYLFFTFYAKKSYLEFFENRAHLYWLPPRLYYFNMHFECPYVTNQPLPLKKYTTILRLLLSDPFRCNQKTIDHRWWSQSKNHLHSPHSMIDQCKWSNQYAMFIVQKNVHWNKNIKPLNWSVSTIRVPACNWSHKRQLENMQSQRRP